MRYLTLLAVLLIFGACLSGCGEEPKSPSGNETDRLLPDPEGQVHDQIETPYEPIAELPVFDADTLAALLQEAAEQDKVLVIDFWATWCVSCVQMFPKLHAAMHDGERHDKVMLVSVTQDAGAAVAQALKYVNDQKAGHGAYVQDEDSLDAVAGAIEAATLGNQAASWGGGALPAVFVFDTDGNLAHAMTETRGSVDDWVAEIAAAADSAAGQ